MVLFIKRFICIALMLILTVVGLYYASNILQEKHRSMQVDTFYDLPRNTIDVLFVGSSQYIRGIAPNVIYKETGISSYNRSTELMSAQGQYLYVADAFKSQSPEVVFLAAPRLRNGYNDKRDMHFHFGLSKVNPSFTKLKVALSYQTESDTMYALDIMLPVFKYNYRWNQLTYRDFFTYSNIETRGQDAYWNIHKFEETETGLFGRIDTDTETEVDYDPIVKRYLEKTIKFCEERGATVILLDAPSIEWTQEKHAASKALAEKQGIEYLDMNIDENLGKIEYNLATDWHDNLEHFNGWGAYKMSLFVSDYLDKNFDLKDYRHSNNTTAKNLKETYEEYYYRYQMFLPEVLKKPKGYNLDNVVKMKQIPMSGKKTKSHIYDQFEKELNYAGLGYIAKSIDVSNLDAVSGIRYLLDDGTSILLVEFVKDSYGHALSGHNRELDFGEYGKFPIVDPVNNTGYIMAFDGIKKNEQAMLLSNIYNGLK